jgi:putative transposase
MPRYRPRYRRNAGATFSLKYHVVFCPKYRRPVLVPPFDARLKEIITEVATEAEMIVHALEIMPDHVHLCLSRQTRRSPSRRSSTASRGDPPA